MFTMYTSPGFAPTTAVRHTDLPCRRLLRPKTTRIRPSRAPAPCAPSSLAQQPARWRLVSLVRDRAAPQSLTRFACSHHIPGRMYVACPPTANSSRPKTLTRASVAKTRTQLNRRLAAGQKLPWPPFGKQWYAGCTTLIIGNSAKAGIRRCSVLKEDTGYGEDG